MERDERVPLQRDLDHPAVRDERHESDPQDRPDDRGAARVAGQWTMASCASRARAPARSSSGCRSDVLDRYPIELSGRHEAAHGAWCSRPCSTRRCSSPTRSPRRSTCPPRRPSREMLVEFRDRGFVKSVIVITHDMSILYQIADTHPDHVRRQAGREGVDRGHHRAPRHPYTRLLISSLPKVGVRYAETAPDGIPGSPPLLLDPPAGCRFRDRCPLAFEKCVEEPPFVEVEPGHFVACWKEYRMTMLQLARGVARVYQVGAFGGRDAARGPRRQLRGRSRARSSR